jgi:hypothetical protein
MPWRRFNDELYRWADADSPALPSHYAKARHVYREENLAAAEPAARAGTLQVVVARPGEPSTPFRLPSDHEERVRRVAAAVDRELRDAVNCRFVPKLMSPDLPGSTASIPEVANEDGSRSSCAIPCRFDGLAGVARAAPRGARTNLLGSTSSPTRCVSKPDQPAAAGGSWTWHFDNHPREVLKLMVYLTDVQGETAPFEYCGHERARRGDGPLAPMHHHGRIMPTSWSGGLRTARGTSRHRAARHRDPLRRQHRPPRHLRARARAMSCVPVRPSLFTARLLRPALDGIVPASEREP